MGCGSWVAASSAAQCSQCDGKRSTTSSTRSARVHGAYRDVLAGHRAFGSRPSPHACARCSRPERQARALLRDARGCPAMRAACSAMRTSCSAMRTSLAAICASRSAIRCLASTHDRRSCPRGLVDCVLATDQNDPTFWGPERILATGVFVLGLEKGMAVVEKLDGVQAIIVAVDGTVTMSKGLRRGK